MKDEIVCITKPYVRVLSRRLHSEVSPAIEWPDEKYYYLFGVRFDEDLWRRVTQKTITPKEILAIPNQEQKSVAMRVYGYDAMIADLKPSILSEIAVSVRGLPKKYQVFEVDLGDDGGTPARFVKVADWSTEREYLLRVDPRDDSCKDPMGALAWMAGVTKAEYEKLQLQS